MKSLQTLILTVAAAGFSIAAEPPPLHPIADFHLAPVEGVAEVSVKKGDRLVILGDSITEQKRYSLMMEAYLTACHPELGVEVRQYGWSGEQIPGLLARLKSDVLRFQPTLATTCYGMNDFQYVPTNPEVTANYKKNLETLNQRLGEAGCRVVIGAAGIITTTPHWVQQATASPHELNLALAGFRNTALAVARAEQTGFADVYGTMLEANTVARTAHGDGFLLAGDDGVHPDWAGHVTMAHAFLTALHCDGDLGSVIWDAAGDTATTSGAHAIETCENGSISISSTAIPFAVGPGDAASYRTIQGGLALVPFEAELNRFTLKIINPKAETYSVTWGSESKDFPAAALTAGILLPVEFPTNPMVEPFLKIWNAIAAKQDFETNQIKHLVRSPDAAKNLDAVFAETEKNRAELVAAIAAVRQPVNHAIQISPQP